MYRYVVWDFDGTLFNSYPITAEAFRCALAEKGICESVEPILDRMKVSMGRAEDWYRSAFSLDDAFFARYRAIRAEMEAEGCKPFAGIPALCEKITRGGGANFLFTHRDASSRSLLARYGMIPYFKECVTVEEGFPRKPAPDAIRYLTRRYALPMSEVAMVGDRALDMESARNAGVAGLLVRFDAAGEAREDAIESVKELGARLGY